MISKDPSFSRKKPLSYFPVQRKINLFNPTPAAFTGQVDYARLASQVNHRLYRYGKMYSLKVDTDGANLVAGTKIDIYCLQNTWAIQKAFEEAKTVFERAYIDERENISDKSFARWRDFRCVSGLTGDMLEAAVENSPETPPLNRLSVGEFDLSLVEDSAGVTRFFTWSNTPAATQYSIMNEYNLAGNTTTSPTTPSGGGPYQDLEADASQVEMEAIQQRGNQPPYNANDMNPIWMRVGTLTIGTNGSQKLSTGFFEAPCGILSIVVQGQTWGTLSDGISVTCQAGDYKGVRAHNMERM